MTRWVRTDPLWEENMLAITCSAPPCRRMPPYHNDLARRLRHRYDGLRLALDWLLQSELELSERALLDLWLTNLDPTLLEAVPELPWPTWANLLGNAWEWLLIQGEAQLGQTMVPVSSLILGADGPSFLDAEQRRWLDHAGSYPVGVYEALEVRPRYGFHVRDLAGGAILEVHHPWSIDLRPGSILGARLVRDEGRWVMSNAFYAFDSAMRSELDQEIQLVARGVDDASARRWILGQGVMEIWALYVLAAHQG